MSYKTCNRCGKEKPATTEYFHRRKKSKDGFNSACKDCVKQYYEENKEKISERKKKYYEEEKEKILERNKKYYDKNKEEILEQERQYYEENKKEILEHKRQYYDKNKEEILEQQRRYYEEEKEKILERNKQYRKENKGSIKEHYKKNRERICEQSRRHYQENKDMYRIKSQRRRSLLSKLPATLTVREWVQIKKVFNNECAYCGMTEEEHRKRFNEQLQQEHFIPLSKGGGYTHNNIIPACRSCNSSKQDTDFFEWYPTHEYYSIRREQKILDHLDYTGQEAQQLTLI